VDITLILFSSKLYMLHSNKKQPEKQKKQCIPSSAKPKTWGKSSHTKTRRSEPFTKAISMRSNSASAQYSLRSRWSIARPLGQTRDELMTTVRSVPSSAALSIFAFTPQSVQYIRLHQEHTPSPLSAHLLSSPQLSSL